MDDLVTDFIAETREGIEALDGELVHFERNPGDPALLGGIFRLIHTIKGTCGFLGLTRLQTVAHSAENVLGAFRDGDLAVTPDSVSAILQTVDLIRSLIDSLAATGVEPVGDDSALIALLDGVMAGEAMAAPGIVAPPPVADARSLIDRLGGDASVDAASEMILDELQDQAFGAIFAEADRDLLQAALQGGAIAAARGSGGLEDFQRRLTAVAPGAGGADVTPRIIDLIGDALVRLGAPQSAVDELALRIEPPLLTESVAAPAAAPETAPAPAPAQVPAPASIPAPAAATKDRPEGEAAVSQTIRVNIDALEHLMTVVSELVLIRNQLIQALRLDPESPFAAPLNRLNQVTSELQEGVMTTRMQPISGAWSKLPRLVRDLAKDLGKEIDLSMVGQDTELDRQVLELIKDPLTHMIRNAVDHGLETPAERVAAGKPPVGRIMLTARHEGGAIVIEVGDDGRGLPAARIRANAIAGGLAPTAEIEAMFQ